jgi:hypothetical protein
MSNSVKISFSVKKQEKVELRSNVPISTEEPEDDDEGSKRSVIALENGKVIRYVVFLNVNHHCNFNL